MKWLTPFLASFRSGRHRSGPEPEHRATPQRPSRRRLRSLTIEVLESRLCPSVRLLAASRDTGTIHNYDGATGRFLGALIWDGYGGLAVPTGMTFGPDGNLFIAGFGRNNVLRYNSETWELIDAFVPSYYDEKTGEWIGSGGLTAPHGISFGPDGHLYVSSGRSVLRYHGTTGQFLGQFVPPGSGGLEGATGLAFGPDGHLYVNSYGNSSVMRYDGTTGSPLPAPGQPGALFITPGSGGLTNPIMGLTFGPDSNLYVGSWGSSSVLRYDATTGDFLDAFVPSGSGGLNSTHGIAFGPDGHLYVCSEFTHSILRYDGESGEFLDAFVPTRGGRLERPTNLVFWDDGRRAPAPDSGTAGSTPDSPPLDDPVAVLGFASFAKLSGGGTAFGRASLAPGFLPATTVPAPPLAGTGSERVAAWGSTAHPGADENGLWKPLGWFSAAAVDLLMGRFEAQGAER